MIFTSAGHPRSPAHPLTLSLTLSLTLALCACEPHELPSDPSRAPSREPSSGAAPAAPTLTTSERPVVYGEDTRREYYQLDPDLDAVWRARAWESTALLVRPSQISVSGQSVQLNPRTLGESRNLCAGEAFADQPEPGHCSGTLIGDDLVLTAGHCVDNAADCDDTRLVFHYLYTAPGALRALTTSDLYRCASVVARRNDSGYDYAVLRLDRPVVGELFPAPVRLEDSPLTVGEPIALLGGPNGLPVKTDTAGRLVSAGTSARLTFQASVDAFGGNSGSGMYNAAGEVVGILVQGRTDYYTDPAGCQRVARVTVDANGRPTDNLGAETGVYVARALDALCAAAPGEALCVDEQGGAMAGAMAGAEGGGVASCGDEYEEDDSAQAAQVTSLTGRAQVHNLCDDALDWLRFPLAAGQRLDIETYPLVQGAPLDTVLTLYDASLRVLAEDDDGGAGLMSFIQGFTAPAAGDYLARVRTYANDTSARYEYKVMLREACAEDAYEVYTPAATGGAAPRALHDDAPLSALPPAALPSVTSRALCDEDWVRLSVPASLAGRGLSLQIQTRVTAPTDTIITLLDASLNTLAENDDAEGLGYGSSLEWPLEVEGEYWLRVRGYQSAYGRDRPYTLHLLIPELCDGEDNDSDGAVDEGLTGCLTCAPDLYEENDSAAQAVALGLGARIELNHCLDSEDWFRFTLAAGARVDVTTEVSYASDTLLELYAPSGSLLAANDDRASGDVSSALLGVTAPTTGRYLLRVAQYNAAFGPDRPYSLLARVACADDAAEPNSAPTRAEAWALPSALSQTPRARVSRETPRSLCDADWLTFEASAGDRFTFEARDLAGALPRLTLSRDFGREALAVSPPVTEGFASLTFEAPLSGRYWLAVESATGLYGGDAGYTLSLVAQAREVCDGADDDLDGDVDEGLLNACGLCGPLPDELCDGRDNDCDGSADEGLLNACGGCGAPPAEVCDRLDNDCDGRADEGTRNACGECGPTPAEVCNGRDDDCDGRSDEGTFNACGLCGEPPPEVCNSLDDDCDGRVDEGLSLNACGVCGDEPFEVCDGQDNDCDGESDEGLLNACGRCGDTPDEVCDGRDNDCDGRTDEGARNACGGCGAVPEEVCDEEDNDCDGRADEGCGAPLGGSGSQAGAQGEPTAGAQGEPTAGAQGEPTAGAQGEPTAGAPVVTLDTSATEARVGGDGTHIGGCDATGRSPAPSAWALLALALVWHRGRRGAPS